MPLRKLLFWPHLICGCLAGAVILVMSATGVLLTYERQILDWADLRALKPAPTAPGSPRLSPEELISKVRQQEGATPVAITLRSSDNAPAALSYGRDKTVFADPRSGEILGYGDPELRRLFRQFLVWHRWLGASEGPAQATGKAITGAANLLFLFLILSGLYIWFPRQWSWRHFRPALWFRAGLAGRARDFNWHNVLGFWMSIPLFWIALSATMFSYPWATRLVYTITGTEAPAPPPQVKGGGKKQSARTEKKTSTPLIESLPLEAPLEGLNAVIARAQAEVPGWLILSVRLAGPLTVTVDEAERGRPDLRTILTFDRSTGELRERETFASYNTGRRARTWLRWIHTGEAGGVPGQTLAGIASLAAVLLVWTGIALALRRFSAWRGRRRRSPEPEPELARTQG
jgi:uncharacterized iron-regulated membrane protein